MVERIERDHARFRRIVRGRIKKHLRKYISSGELIGRKGKKLVSIPLPQIDLPRFRYGEQQTGGVGQGEGEKGDPIGGEGQAGDQPGQHVLEVDISIDELARILGEELELPKIEPRGKKEITSLKSEYTGISRTGPESLRHFKRTYKEALKRQICAGLYDPERPIIVPIREDRRYRSWKTDYLPQSRAVIIYMMDVSGSMGGEQKEVVRIEAFWIDTWLRHNYKDIETRYIAHDAVAREVTRETFFHLREGGGTKISSAYSVCAEMIEREYDPSEYNIYPFHFSDGDNWGGEDTKKCLQLLKEKLLPASNIFCYGQVKSAYGSGQFIKDLKETFEKDDRLVMSEIPDRDAIYDSIKAFLGKGK
jgi:uncharacterized sporulation protein YeaH/YhbH (DUF444 family)